MALTPFRWVALAVVGMAIVFAIVVQDTRQRTRYQDPDEARLLGIAMHTSQRASLQARQFRVLQLLDSLGMPSPRRDTAVVRVSYDRALPAELRLAFDSAVAQARERIGAIVLGTDVAVVYDTARVIRGYPQLPTTIIPVYALPREEGQRCGVVIRVGRVRNQEVRRTLATDDAISQLTGPCAYYSVFGMPGHQVEAWLRAQGAVLAHGGSWTRSSEPPRFLRQRSRYFDAAHPALDYLTPEGGSCVVGDLAACEQAVMTRAPISSMLVAGPSVTLRRMGPVGRDYSAFGPRQTEMLAGMVRTMGRERFAAFWRSDEPVPAAFERASGVRLGAWVSSWAAEQYGRPQRGPRVSAVGLLGAVVLVAAGLFFGLRTAARREFA
ncbi:MAG TPA: hypothetical protein VFO55_03780 [Gemmatimonadaceae bacterium]|nr:hypothetical protein [Gemmatimonadaceae bacterium]